MSSFGKDEGDKARGILAPDNDITELNDKNVSLGIDGWVFLLSWMYDVARLLQAELFKEEWKSGFKQFALKLEQVSIFGAHLPHPDTGEVYLSVSLGATLRRSGQCKSIRACSASPHLGATGGVWHSGRCTCRRHSRS